MTLTSKEFKRFLEHEVRCQHCRRRFGLHHQGGVGEIYCEPTGGLTFEPCEDVPDEPNHFDMIELHKMPLRPVEKQ